MKSSLVGVLASALLMTSAAWASIVDDQLTMMAGTISVRAEPYMVDGQLSGCQYVFTALTQDWVYRGGKYIKVDGSIALMYLGGKLGNTLKVVVNEVSSTPDGKLDFHPSAPSRAYLIGDDFGTNLSGLVKASNSDTPGALFSIFNIDQSLKILTDAAQSNKITIAFNKDQGKSDIMLRLELDVSDRDGNGQRIRSDEASMKFSSCVLSLLRDK